MAIETLRTLSGASVTQLTDAELTAFLLLGDDNLKRALGYTYAALSRNAAAAAVNMAQDDLRVSTEKKAADFLALANLSFAQADRADVSESFFEIVPYNTAEYVAKTGTDALTEVPNLEGYYR